MNKAYMILDLQFGSTGKGLLAGYLATKEKPDTIVTAWGPNAGHTYIDSNGRKFIHRMLANGIVSSNLKTILIGPGSVIDTECLLMEITQCRDLLRGKRIVIHPQAAVVMPHHLTEEKANVTIGSTMKGTGAAVVQRINRNPDKINTAKVVIGGNPLYLDTIRNMGINIDVCDRLYRNSIQSSQVMQIEGAQGYSLSIYHGLYPYTTSRDVTPSQVMADCALPFHIKPEVYGTLRTFPIRVANRFDDDGNMIGTSGPGYEDQKEMDWADVGVEPELTTVTQLPRRIFEFSDQQLKEACFQCSPNKIFLNFANYLEPEQVRELVERIYNQTFVRVEWIGVGPYHNDVLTDNEFEERYL